MNSSNSSLVPVQNMRMSSMYLLNSTIQSLPHPITILSMKDMKIFAIVGADLVPIAIPISCMKSFESNLKTLNDKINIMRVVRNEVGY